MVGRATDALSKSQWSCRQVQRVCGAIVSMLPVVQSKAMRRTRKLNGFLSKHMGSVPGKGLDELHEASDGGRQELQHWMKMLARDPKRKSNRRAHAIRTLASDASATGCALIRRATLLRLAEFQMRTSINKQHDARGHRIDRNVEGKQKQIATCTRALLHR